MAILEFEQEIADAEAEINKNKNERIIAQEEEVAERRREIQKELYNGIFDIAKELSDLLFSIPEKNIERRQEASDRLYEDETGRIDKYPSDVAVVAKLKDDHIVAKIESNNEVLRALYKQNRSATLENVPVLQSRRMKRAESDRKVIDLLVYMRDNGLAQDADIKTISDRIINNYTI